MFLKKIDFQTKKKRRRSRSSVDWNEADDIKRRIVHIVEYLSMEWIEPERIFCFRSEKSKARAYARVWGLSKIWQQALQTDAAYCIEVLSEKFDKLSDEKKSEILIHELAHIPKNFSGSLLPHIRKRGHKMNFHDRVHEMVSEYKKLNKKV